MPPPKTTSKVQSAVGSQTSARQTSFSVGKKIQLAGAIATVLALIPAYQVFFKDDPNPELNTTDTEQQVNILGDGNAVTIHQSALPDQSEFLAQLKARISDLEALRDSLQQSLDAQDKVSRLRIANLNEQLAEAQARLAEPDQSYQEYLDRIAELEELVAEFSGEVSEEEIKQAFDAIARFDYEPADQLLAEVYQRENESGAVQRMARAAYGRGLIAEEDVRWFAAAEFYQEAARLDPTLHHLNKAGTSLLLAGKYAQAMRHAEDALALAKANSSPSNAVATMMNNLAHLLHITGRYAEAEPLYREALEIRREALDEGHPNVGQSLNNLAALLYDTRRHTEAEPLYREALDIRREALDEGHPAVATGLNNLATLLYATGRYAEAEPLFHEALAIKREALGEGHPTVAIGLNNLAGLLEATGRYAEAEPLYREALAIKREALGEGHPSVATGLYNLAALLHGTGRYAEAEPLSREALEIRREALGEGHPDVGESLNNLASLLYATGRYAEAEPLYLEALGILRAALGDDHPNTQSVAANTLIHLRDHAPNHPEHAALVAVFGAPD